MIKVKVEIEVVINDDNGYDEGDVATSFHGMGNFADKVKSFVEGSLDNDITVDTVVVDGTEY